VAVVAVAQFPVLVVLVEQQHLVLLCYLQMALVAVVLPQALVVLAVLHLVEI
jgi:hypothetical protein